MTIVKETHLRTISKTVLYRIFSIIAVMLITIAFGASAATAGKVGLVVLIAGTAIYYLHDRIWLWFGWDRNNIGDDTIKRSMAKTVVYRIIVMIVAFITAKVFVTDSNSTALAITISQMLVNLVLYYVIERLFNRLQWGKLLPVA